MKKIHKFVQYLVLMAVILSACAPATTSIPPASPNPAPQTPVPSQGTKAPSVVVPSQNAAQVTSPAAQPAPRAVKRPVVTSTPIPSKTPNAEPIGRIDWFKSTPSRSTMLFVVGAALVANDATGVGIVDDPIAVVIIGTAVVAYVFETPQVQNAMRMTIQQITAWAASFTATTALAYASEEAILAASAKQLFPPIEGKWKESRTPLLPPVVDTGHMKSGDENRVLERLLALAAAWQLSQTATPPQCWHRKGGGTLLLPTGAVEEIEEAVALFWDGFTLKATGLDAMKGVGFLGQIVRPNLSTSFGNRGILKSTYNDGSPVWKTIEYEDPRCKWTTNLMDMFFRALKGEGNGFPPNFPPLLPQ